MEPNNGIMDRRADGVLSIRRPTSEEWRLSAGWLIATIVGGLLPLWGSYLMLKLGGESVFVADFVSHGEFALYSASLLAPVFFIILRELPAGFPFRLWIGLVSVVLLLISALTFGCVFWIDRVPEGAVAPVLNVEVRIVLSFVL